MAIRQQEPVRLNGSVSVEVPTRRAPTTAPAHGTVLTAYAARFFAVFRVAVGFVFLWAFLDKTFGFGYATPSARAWFHGWAGAPWADWLFMLGLLGIGVALTLGVALRIAAASGTAMMLFMWAAEWPLAKHTSDGALSASSNPIVDYHIIYAFAVIAVAVLAAGSTWGLGKLWAKLPFVQRNRWLL